MKKRVLVWFGALNIETDPAMFPFSPLRPSAESPGFCLDLLFAASCPEVIYTNWLPRKRKKKNPLCSVYASLSYNKSHFDNPKRDLQ